MFSQLIARAEAQLTKELPFVIYRKPDSDLVVSIYQKNAHLQYVEDFSSQGFVFAPFDSDSPSVLIPLDDTISAPYRPSKINKRKTFTAREPNEGEYTLYTDLVKRAITEIRQGILKKVVVSRKLRQRTTIAPLDLFKALLDTYSKAFCYIWYHPKVGLWLGATPEILLRTNGKKVTTMSLAGTKPYVQGKDPEWEAKEMQEQAMVTEYIVDNLNNLLHDLKQSKTTAVRAGNLWHLRTEIAGNMKSKDLSRVAHALHPTPAVCGVPLRDSKAFILDNENYDREFYTGFLGELNVSKNELKETSVFQRTEKGVDKDDVTTELFVNLRCMQIKGEEAVIYVGGGITHDSDPNKEWEETVSKSKTILRVL